MAGAANTGRAGGPTPARMKHRRHAGGRKKTGDCGRSRISRDRAESRPMKLLGKLVLWQKLLLIVVALLVASALLSVFYMKNVNDTVRQANTELSGARYTRELDNFLFEVIRHRALVSVVLNGDAN